MVYQYDDKVCGCKLKYYCVASNEEKKPTSLLQSLLLSFWYRLLSCKVASPAWPLLHQSQFFHPLLPPPVDLAAVMLYHLLHLETAWWGCRGEADVFCTGLTPNNHLVVSLKSCRFSRGSKTSVFIHGVNRRTFTYWKIDNPDCLLHWQHSLMLVSPPVIRKVISEYR